MGSTDTGFSKHVAQQPAPNNDPNAKPLWPMIISDIEDGIALKSRGDKRMANEAKILRLVATDMRARHEFGLKKYGMPIVATNGRDHLSDAYQEFLDALVYLRAEIEKVGGFDVDDSENGMDPLGLIPQLYWDTYTSLVKLRKILLKRDGR